MTVLQVLRMFPPKRRILEVALNILRELSDAGKGDICWESVALSEFMNSGVYFSHCRIVCNCDTSLDNLETPSMGDLTDRFLAALGHDY
jgi:hypothetical protein